MTYAVSSPRRAPRVTHQRARGELDSARYYEGFHASLGTEPWFREPTCDDFWPELTCNKSQPRATAQTGAADAAERATCLAEGGSWLGNGQCVQRSADPGAPASSGGGGGNDDSSSEYDAEADTSGGGGGHWWARSSPDSSGSMQAGLSTAGWFAVAVGVMAAGIYAFDAFGSGGRR